MSESLPAYAAKERPWASWGARCAGLWWVQTEGSFRRSPSPSDNSISAPFGDDVSGSRGGGLHHALAFGLGLLFLLSDPGSPRHHRK
jgi:hypothetical protein